MYPKWFVWVFLAVFTITLLVWVFWNWIEPLSWLLTILLAYIYLLFLQESAAVLLFIPEGCLRLYCLHSLAFASISLVFLSSSQTPAFPFDFVKFVFRVWKIVTYWCHWWFEFFNEVFFLSLFFYPWLVVHSISVLWVLLFLLAVWFWYQLIWRFNIPWVLISFFALPLFLVWK